MEDFLLEDSDVTARGSGSVSLSPPPVDNPPVLLLTPEHSQENLEESEVYPLRNSANRNEQRSNFAGLSFQS